MIAPRGVRNTTSSRSGRATSTNQSSWTTTTSRLFSVGIFVVMMIRLKQESLFVAKLVGEQEELQHELLLVQTQTGATPTIVTTKTVVPNIMQSLEGAQKKHPLPTIKQENNQDDTQATVDAVGNDRERQQKESAALINDDDGLAFNYSAFWQRALETAILSEGKANDTIIHAEEPSSQKISTKPLLPCPKVYMYNEHNDLPSHLSDSSENKEMGFGKKVLLKGAADRAFQGYLYNTNQYAFPSILQERLKKSKECRTRNAHEADLFFVPILTAPKGANEWKEACSNKNNHIGEDIRDALLSSNNHLNATNACRHFFALGKGHYIGEYCPGWFSNPIDELRPFSRLAYSHRSFDRDLNGRHTAAVANNSTRRNHELQQQQFVYPNLFSVPYPSSLHFGKSKSTKTLPQFNDNASTKRKALMTFVGKDDHGDMSVRQQIARQCKQYNDKSVCAYMKRWMTKYATSKSRATFCLEPAGDSPWRKSLADSITFGCIPVLFSELTDDVAPWFWNDWKDRGRVLVPREEFVAGRIDLKMLLQSIPPQLLEMMQTTLREKARRFQYSVDDDQADGIRIILDNLHREALDRERRGICGY